MENNTTSSEWDQLMRASVAAPEPPESFLADLDGRLRAQQRKRALRAGFQRRVFAAALGSTLTLALLLVAVAGPERVIAAVRNALGFIPGIGFVSADAPVRVLAEPVRVEREGIAITLTRVTAESTGTNVSFTVEGLPVPDGAPSAGEGICPGVSAIAWPGGGLFSSTGGGGGPLGGSFTWNESFPSIPPTEMEATLIIPCIPMTVAGDYPANWEIPFRLVPTDAPALFATVEPTATVSPPPSATATDTKEAFPGISIGVERISELEDGYLLIGILEWDEKQYAMADASGSEFTLTDRDGRILPVENIGSVPEEPAAPNSAFWSLRVSGKNLRGPVTIRLDSLFVFLRDPLTFSFDTGENPRAGQEWEIGKSFSVSGHPLTVLRAEYILENSMPGLSVSVQTPPEILHVVVGSNNPPEAGGGPGESFESGIYRWRVFLQSPPSGRVELFIQQMTIQGEWTTTWDPPQD
ncbi:MAG: hypothetical protein A3K46_08550 [Chloroflexi bacterium RBG_13_60_9]|nr:MAG: hypothetical protein A3K46_08550 [Chloroflexi bacterium RBG_13_60_9]